MHTEIPKADELVQQVFLMDNPLSFERIALDLFRFQYHSNPVYKSYCNVLQRDARNVQSLHQIPFLPISFFKTHNVQCIANSIGGIYFESSRTTGTKPSRHLVPNIEVYKQSFRQAFSRFYGAITDYCILGLLPSYLAQQHSSLVYMVNDLIAESKHLQSGFYLYDFDRLALTLADLERAKQKTILFGVTYALLDFAHQHGAPLQYTTIIETGGMKGRKRELVREEVHGLLKKAFSVSAIHSEYGMTELLSQAYALGGGVFYAPPWMRILIRDEDDPFAFTLNPGTGSINIIDLANIYSCAFIATEDVGRLHANGHFEIMGRLDNAEIRGCSLLAL